mgnify:CR=1 FL=1
MANKVQFSLKNVHYAPITTGDDGSITFGAPVHIPGAVSLTLTRQGSEVKFIADGVVYYASYSNEGYSGTLTIALIPAHFRKTILKEVEDETDHVLVEYADTETAPFALLFEIEGDEKATRRVLYYCKVGVPGEDADGQAQKTPKTEAMDITASALADGRTRARTMENTRDEVFNNWFKKVWEPHAITENAQASRESATNPGVAEKAADMGPVSASGYAKGV